MKRDARLEKSFRPSPEERKEKEISDTAPHSFDSFIRTISFHTINKFSLINYPPSLLDTSAMLHSARGDTAEGPEKEEALLKNKNLIIVRA